MYIRILVVLCSITFLDKTDGAPRWSWGNLAIQDPDIQESMEIMDSCPKGSECLQALKCPEQSRRVMPSKSCSRGADGSWVCCITHTGFNVKYSTTPSSSFDEPLIELQEFNSSTHSYDSKGNHFSAETVIPGNINDTSLRKSKTEKDGNDTDNNTWVTEEYKNIPSPSEYRRNFDSGTSHERYQRPGSHYKPWRNSWRDSYSSHSNKWGNNNSWSRPSEERNTHNHDTVEHSYSIDPRSMVTKNSFGIKSNEDSPEISVVYWNGKFTSRPHIKTTKSSWHRGNTSKSTMHWENWKTTSTQRKKSTTPNWDVEYSPSSVSWTTSRPGRNQARNPWNVDHTSSLARTMVHGNRIPTQPQKKPTKQPGWDGKVVVSTVRMSTKYLVHGTTPLPKRKPISWGSYLTTKSSSMTTKRTPYIQNKNSGRASTVSKETSFKPTVRNSRSTISYTTPKTYGTASTKKSGSDSSDSPPIRWPTAKPLMPKSTQYSWPSTTKKYITTTDLPNININMCGVRQSNSVTSRGRNAKIENDPDAVSVHIDSQNERSRKPFQRIVGGQEAEPFSWPWVAALYRMAASGGNRFLSAGSLINENFVLTAAHVFTPDDLRTASYVVMLGTHTAKEAMAEYIVSSVLQHPDYQQRFYYNDIALLRLEHPVVFNNYVMPVCLPSPFAPLLRDVDLVGKRATVMGWGDESYGGITSRVLLEASFPIVSKQSCNASYIQVAANRFPYGITTNMLCAGDPNGGKDACQGDSGGPLTTVENGRYTQVGIVSFGYKCGDKEYPGVYTKVASYLSWIAETTQDNDYDYYAG